MFLKINNKPARVNGKYLCALPFPKANIIADYCVVNGAVYDLATNKKVNSYEVSEGGFHGNTIRNIVKDRSLSSFTIVMIADRPGKNVYSNYFHVNNDSYPIRIQNGLASAKWFDLNKRFFPNQVIGKYESTGAGLSPRLLTVGAYEFLAYSRNAEDKTILFQQNEIQTTERYTEELEDLTSLTLSNGAVFKRFMVYDRSLMSEELEQIRAVRYGENTKLYTPDTLAKGISGLGCPNGYHALSSGIPEWADYVEYEAIEQEEPVVTEDMSVFTAVQFVNPISSLEVGKKYNLEAHPYPYDVSKTPFNVEYVSSNKDVLECYKGFLIAKAPGTATITAKISNTDISAALEIAVTEAVQQEENFRHVGLGFIDKGSSLLSDDPEKVLKAMIAAIYKAAQKGYNGIVFPKRTYHIKPFQKDAHCNIPSNFTVDFNGSTIYIVDNAYCHCEAGAVNQSDGYTLFRFGEGVAEDYYGNPCENSTIKNATVYGERYENTEYAENQYTEFVVFCAFGCRSSGCKITNINFDSTCGFNIITETNGYKYWTGTALDGARRGCTLEEDFEAGRIAENGQTVTNEPGWYYTTDFIKIGYYYGTGSYTSILQYKVGQMGYMTYGTSGRWYDIFFYDADYKLVKKGIRQFGLEPYDFPENAVYMKVNIMNSGVPKNSTQTDVPAVVRLYPAVEPDLFEISDCRFINPHASAISLTGGVRGIIENCYAQQGKRYGWSIDYEDGWMAMRHNMMYRVMCNGMVNFAAGHNSAVVSCAIDTMQGLGDNEGTRYINNHFGVLRQHIKTNDVVECCTQISTYARRYQYAGVSTVRDINNTGF